MKSIVVQAVGYSAMNIRTAVINTLEVVGNASGVNAKKTSHSQNKRI